MTPTRWLAAPLFLVASLVTACSDSPTPPRTVNDVLGAFGVDLSDTPRVDDDQQPLPDSFAPLGGRTTIGRFDELALFGIRLADPRLAATGAMPMVDVTPDANNQLSPSLLADPTATPWLTGSLPRAAASGDFDRDGIDELAIVYQEPGAPLKLVLQKPGAAPSDPVVIGLDPVSELFAVSGDFDGDLTDDLVVAEVSPGTVTLRLFENLPAGWVAKDIGSPTVTSPAADVDVVLAAGNLDRDRPLELGVVVNELTGSTGSSRHVIYDDATTGFAVLRSGPVTVTTDTEAVTARAGGIAFGDVDGDGVDEVVLGGLTAVGNTCNLTTSYAVEVLDDARHGLDRLAANIRPWSDTRQPCASGSNHRMEAFHIVTGDLDGDGANEIATNEYVYDDLRASGGTLSDLFAIPQAELLTPGTSGSQYRFSWRTTSFATGDVTSDRRDDLVFYTQRDQNQVVEVWSDDQIAGWHESLELPTAFANGLDAPVRPEIVLADLDLDAGSMALEYSEGSHRLEFTEPVLIAALAAAPCSTSFGQDLALSCRTAFGKAVSDTTDRTNGWSFSAGVSVGYEAEFSVLGVKVGGAEAILDTRNTVRQHASTAYTLTTSVLRETGPLEDSVIFTTIPLDVYTYTILAHPNPELVGGKIEIRVPRTPITILAERTFYNEHILPDAFHLDSAVFGHTAGDPSSYRDAAAKDAVLAQATGLQSSQVDVGQGSGQTVVSITKLDQTSTGSSFDFEASLDLRASDAGVVGGYSIGGGVDSDLSITHGDETIYQGSVANVSADHFPDDAYRFGLFTYIYDHPTTTQQKFEVVDYWVERQ